MHRKRRALLTFALVALAASCNNQSPEPPGPKGPKPTPTPTINPNALTFALTALPADARGFDCNGSGTVGTLVVPGFGWIAGIDPDRHLTDNTDPTVCLQTKFPDPAYPDVWVQKFRRVHVGKCKDGSPCDIRGFRFCSVAWKHPMG